MEHVMTVYESPASRAALPDEFERFESDLARLSDAGIAVRRVMCSSEEDLGDGEVRDTVGTMGMGSLPATEYDGVCVIIGHYPGDQELVDYLDVPEGVLDAVRTTAPPMPNDMAPHCFLRPRDLTF